ncbi:MAG: hypothetical protein MJA27_13070, partial [Pseudanabaenales cyanobacterium]|nr:hypothetical protein [Pseudanabaenales cyanobacterium]
QKNQQLQHEIAERHKAENALRIYIHALTHDLKNPVSGMAGILRNFLDRRSTNAQGELSDFTPVKVARATFMCINFGCRLS